MRSEGWETIAAIGRDRKHRECMRANELIAAYAYGRPTILIESSSEELKAFATTLRDLVLASQAQVRAEPEGTIEGEVVKKPMPEEAAVAKMLALSAQITGAGAIATSPLIGEEKGTLET